MVLPCHHPVCLHVGGIHVCDRFGSDHPRLSDSTVPSTEMKCSSVQRRWWAQLRANIGSFRAWSSLLPLPSAFFHAGWSCLPLSSCWVPLSFLVAFSMKNEWKEGRKEEKGKRERGRKEGREEEAGGSPELLLKSSCDYVFLCLF